MKKVIIIGAGVSGLSSGVFARMNGFQTEIYEMHNIPGGECTGWTRGGYHFDNCIHWLTGTDEKTGIYKLWKTVGALGDVKVINDDILFTVVRNNKILNFYRDLNKLENHLKEISPEDNKNIEELIETIKAFETVEVPTGKPFDHMNVFDYIKLGRSYKTVGKYMSKFAKITMSEYASKFKSELIREALDSFVPSNYCAVACFTSMGTITSGNGGWPEGGSLKMSIRMEKKYKDLGGKVFYNKRVKKIVIENGIATGIELFNGEIIKSDFVISAGDGVKLIKELLQDKYRDDYFDTALADDEKYPIHSSVDVGLGIGCDLSDRYSVANFEIEPFNVAGVEINKISLKQYPNEKGFAPEGSSVVRVTLLTTEYNYFKKLKEQSEEEYKLEKKKIGEEIIKRVETIYPETKEKIEVVDVTTPVTYERYCNAYKGAWMAFDMVASSKAIRSKGRINGIKNLYVAGQWIWVPGGLPSALVAGKWAVQRMCKDEKIKMKVS